MIEYKIVEKAENALDAKIEKIGAPVKFTLGDIKRDEDYLNRSRAELVAQIGLEEAKKQNVLNTHPHIAEVSEEDRVATYLYQQSYAFCKVAENKLAEIDKQIADYKAEKDEIFTQTGLSDYRTFREIPDKEMTDADLN